MGYSYLKDKIWSDVTRDERTFCLYLYNAFHEHPEKLIEAINSSDALKGKFSNKLELDGKKWELGYEVCFYRDLLFSNGVAVKGDEKLLKKWNIKNPEKLIKRTFDLCLFSESEIIIIEAKASGGLNSAQFIDFVKDKIEVEEDGERYGDYINKIYKGLDKMNGRGDGIKPQDVKLVVLASSNYFDSPSFELSNKRGVGKKYIIDEAYADAIVSWNEIAVFMKTEVIGSLMEYNMMNRANASYGEEIKVNPNIEGYLKKN